MEATLSVRTTGKYPPGLLCDAFREEFEYQDPDESSQSTIPAGLKSIDRGLALRVANIFKFGQNRRWTLETLKRYEAIVGELHKFHAVPKGNWKALAIALMLHHVPAFNQNSAGRPPTNMKSHIHTLVLFEKIQRELFLQNPSKFYPGKRGVKKQVYSLMGEKLGKSHDQIKDQYRQAKEWLSETELGAAWRPLLFPE